MVRGADMRNTLSPALIFSLFSSNFLLRALASSLPRLANSSCASKDLAFSLQMRYRLVASLIPFRFVDLFLYSELFHDFICSRFKSPLFVSHFLLPFSKLLLLFSKLSFLILQLKRCKGVSLPSRILCRCCSSCFICSNSAWFPSPVAAPAPAEAPATAFSLAKRPTFRSKARHSSAILFRWKETISRL